MSHKKKYILLLCSVLCLSAIGAGYLYYKNNHPKYFLVLSGGRTGSTWLVSMLNKLSNTNLYEIMWEPLVCVGELQIPIQHGDMGIKEKLRIKNGDEKLKVLGSKLILSNIIYPEHIRSAIRTYLNDNKDIKLIFLYRNYYDTFLSWYCRGVYHDSTHPHLQQDTVEKEPQKLFFIGAPGEDDRDTYRQSDAYPGRKLNVSYTDAINRLLVLFCNDLLLATQCQQEGGTYFAIDYNQIAQKLKDIVRFCQIDATDDAIKDALKKPIVNKLKSLEGYVYPKKQLFNVAEILNKKLMDVLNHHKKMEDMLILDEKNDRITLVDEELKALFGEAVPLMMITEGMWRGFLIPIETPPSF